MLPPPPEPFLLSEPVQRARRDGAPIVLLESCVFTHGLPHPEGAALAADIAALVAARGVVPAVVAVLDGRLRVGLDPAEVAALATRPGVRKLASHDLPVALARGHSGGTTVSSSLLAARCLDLPVFATGGIGGVHRGAAHSFDVSRDLHELARTPAIAVAAGAKSILDLPATVEMLETLGVPVVGLGTDEFPAFYARSSGIPLAHRAEEPAEIAAIYRQQRALGLEAALLAAVPIPAAHEVPRAELEPLLGQALASAAARGITAKEVTPFLLDALFRATAGRTLRANRELLLHNAAVASDIARALAQTA
jgi:pseudouridine-5'-phosphate glycosidase